MSTALEAASLIMIPTSYSDGLLASVKPNDGAGDFTFARCDGAAQCDLAATRVNADGYIEKGYENLLLQSNSFDTTWNTTTSASVTGGQTGYDGSSDAWLLSKTDSNQYLSQGSISVGLQTFSIYAKAGDSDFVYVRFLTGGERVTFDLQNGITLGLSGSIDAKIELVSGTTDWYRCSLTADFNSNVVRIYPAEGNGDTSGTSGSIYIQDAMLNQGMVAYPYVETTTAPVAGGILEDEPRLDYSGSCPALLLEPQRTNAFPHSEYFDSTSWTKGGNADIETNAAISPEGIQNASKLYGSTTNYTFTRLQGDGALFRQGRTLSIFAKAGEVSEFLFFSGNLGQGPYFNLNNGSITGYYQGDSSQIDDAYSVNYGNGWYRYVVVFSANSYPRLFSSENQEITFNQTAGNGIYLYGFQAEQDATYPTSYIPTYGTSQTRLDESTSVLTLPETLTDNYTLFFDFKELIAGNGWVKFVDSSNSVVYVFYSYGGHYDIFNGSSFMVDVSADPDGKIALKQSGSSVKIFVNGVDKTKAGATANLTDIAKFAFGAKPSNNSGTLNQMLVFPKALSDDECIELTTI